MKTRRSKNIWRLILRYRKIFILAAAAWALWFFGVGALAGWLFSRPNIERFPDIGADDRLLILAPHIDDETIGTGGLIQQALLNKAGVKVVYLTNGDNNLSSTLKEDLKINPDSFIRLGEGRMAEGKRVGAILGLPETDLIFLGYPDRGLTSLLNKYYDSAVPYASQGTNFSYNPYRGTHREQQKYLGINVLNDLKEIVVDFKPTIIIAPHYRDKHPDHRATLLFLEKLTGEMEIKAKIFSYLVHYSDFPKDGNKSDFIFPPKKLFSKIGWYSFDLTEDEENKKEDAANQYSSQSREFLKKFVRRNEIFEEVDE